MVPHERWFGIAVPLRSREPRLTACLTGCAQAFLCEAGGTIPNGEFWMDTFKTHCYVGFETVDQAVATAKHAHGKQWPPLSHKRLRVTYSSKSVPEVRVVCSHYTALGKQRTVPWATGRLARRSTLMRARCRRRFRP